MPYYEPDAPASEWIVDARREQKGVRVAMDTVGEFVRDVGGREIRPPACPILPRPRTIGRSTGIRQQYQQWNRNGNWGEPLF